NGAGPRGPAGIRAEIMRETVRDRRAVPLLRAVPALIPCSRRRPTSSCPWEPFHAPARPVRHPAAARARPPGAALAAPRRRHRAGPPAGHAAGADRGAGPAALARSVRPGAPLGALAAETLLPPPFGDRRNGRPRGPARDPGRIGGRGTRLRHVRPAAAGPRDRAGQPAADAAGKARDVHLRPVGDQPPGPAGAAHL